MRATVQGRRKATKLSLALSDCENAASGRIHNEIAVEFEGRHREASLSTARDTNLRVNSEAKEIEENTRGSGYMFTKTDYSAFYDGCCLRAPGLLPNLRLSVSKVMIKDVLHPEGTMIIKLCSHMVL